MYFTCMDKKNRMSVGKTNLTLSYIPIGAVIKPADIPYILCGKNPQKQDSSDEIRFDPRVNGRCIKINKLFT